MKKSYISYISIGYCMKEVEQNFILFSWSCGNARGNLEELENGQKFSSFGLMFLLAFFVLPNLYLCYFYLMELCKMFSISWVIMNVLEKKSS